MNKTYPVIYLEKVTQVYQVKFNFPDRVEEKKIVALKDINLTVHQGETVAILGPNGSGKTTLLKVIAGLLSPDSGKVKIEGKVRGIFELGAGLIPEFSGYRNIEMVLKLYGEYTPDKVKKIIEFSELGEFIYAPVKIYSQGMYLRLAFSIAVNTEHDIILVDDILAVGDTHFQKKCFNKIKEIISQGKTVLLVTHSFDLAQSLCLRGVVMERGRIISGGSIHEMRPFFDSLTGNLSGVGILKNDKISFIFNNGRASLICENEVITTDLGLFGIYYQDGKTLYSSDFQWQVEEKDNNLIAEGKFEGRAVVKYSFWIEGEYLKLSLESIFRNTLFNIMLHESYSKVKSSDQVIEIPPIDEGRKREWDKELEMECDHLIFISSQEKPLVSLFFQKANISIYNFNFHNKARIFQMVQENRNSNLVIRIQKDSSPLSLVKSNVVLKNLFYSHIPRRISNIFQSIYFVSYKESNLYLTSKREIIERDGSFQVTEIVKSREDNFNIFFYYNVNDNDISFSIFADREVENIQGLDFYILYYNLYQDKLKEKMISEGDFQNMGAVNEFRLSCIQDKVPDLAVRIKPPASVFIKKKNDLIILRFLFIINIKEHKFEFNYERCNA